MQKNCAKMESIGYKHKKSCEFWQKWDIKISQNGKRAKVHKKVL